MFSIDLAEIKQTIYENLNDKDKVIEALSDNKKYSQLLGNLVNEEKTDQLIFEQTLRQEKEKLRIAQRDNNLLGLSISALVIMLIGVLILYLNIKKQRVQIQEQTKTIENQFIKTTQLYNYQTILLSEIHHRVKNNLQLISSLLALQKAKIDNLPYSNSILENMSQRISSISLIHEQLYKTKEFDKINASSYAKSLINNFEQVLSDQQVSINFDINDITLNLETMTPIGLIWAELINNSLKYYESKNALKIFFKLLKLDDHYLMHYYDNGVGYPNQKLESNSTGMGYLILNSLSNQLSADTKTFNDNGAHFQMTFKEKTISPL
jgi:two-component sensor histidine kinase